MINFFLSLCQSILNFFRSALDSTTINFPTSHISVVIHVKQSSSNIGEGAFSTVYKVEERRSGQPYALKRMLLQSPECIAIANNEIQAFRRFKHKNILRLVDFREAVEHNNRKVMYLLLPYCDSGSLRNVLNNVLEKKVKRPSLKHILNQFKQVCEAVNVLHTFHPTTYIHQDIKPENILFENKTIPLLTDFGSVRVAEVHIQSRKDMLTVIDEASQFCTAPYRAPELYEPPKDSILDTRTDVWALGCLLFAWWFGYSPFECEFSNDDRLKVVECSVLRVLSNIPKKTKHNTPEDLIIYQLTEWMLVKDMTQRVFTEQVIDRLERILANKESGLFDMINHMV